MLELVNLKGYGAKKVDFLSGGQQQRVAIARALINHPRMLLLDEPLGALDLQLRKEMQIELKRMQQQLGITFIYVTHDQEEALTMSDRIVVMNLGRIDQIGTLRTSTTNRPTPLSRALSAKATSFRALCTTTMTSNLPASTLSVWTRALTRGSRWTLSPSRRYPRQRAGRHHH